MSEQENSRSPPSTTLPAGAPAGSPGHEQEPHTDPCDAGKSGSAGSDAGMGNNIVFTSEKSSDEAASTEEGNEEDSGSKEPSDNPAKDKACAEANNRLPCPGEAMLLDLKESEVPRDGAEPSADAGEGPGDKDAEGEDRRDSCEEGSGEGSGSPVGDSGYCANNSDDSRGKEGEGKESVLGNGCEGKEDTDDGSSDVKDSADYNSGEENTPSCNGGEKDTPDCTSDERDTAHCTNDAKDASNTSTTEQNNDTPNNNEVDKPGSTNTISNSIVDRDGATVDSIRDDKVPPPLNNTLLPLSAPCGIPEMGQNGASELQAPTMDHVPRDTDSEAGDSVCSEDGDQEVCRGGGDCPHQEAEEGWEYVVDEEFNVPRRPVFNGAADHLERRSSLKRRASEDSEGGCLDGC